MIVFARSFQHPDAAIHVFYSENPRTCVGTVVKVIQGTREECQAIWDALEPSRVSSVDGWFADSPELRALMKGQRRLTKRSAAKAGFERQVEDGSLTFR